MSLVTSVKDYVEITHKLIEIEPIKNYTEFGTIFTYFVFSMGDFFKNLFSFSLFKNIWSIPIIIPDIASAMISEVSVLDSYFNLDLVLVNNSANTSLPVFGLVFEKFIIGFINSLFLILPTSTSSIITLRRFVMQGLEAGYVAGLGTIAGNFLWLSSIILGLRFFVIPWLSLDIFRYLLCFILLVKYIWDSSKERRMALEDVSKWKIFILNFLLTITEQSIIYPFISNISIGPDVSILEGFPVDNYVQFLTVHGAYLFGILAGSFSLLQFTCWFWENPAFSIYLWITTKSPFKIYTSSYYKILNFTFLYATMLCAIASIPYYGLDYAVTNPIGLVPHDRILNQKKSQSNPDKLITETAFLNISPTDKNARIKDGVHARRERWKQSIIKYSSFDAQNMDQGIYDFLTIEDLNYGFDRFWLRRKMRNHQIRFRLFPGPWMRSLKKQLNNPADLSKINPSKGFGTKEVNQKIESGKHPRIRVHGVQFFRLLFEQFYHPIFHRAIKHPPGNITVGDKSIKTISKRLNTNIVTGGLQAKPEPLILAKTLETGDERLVNKQASLLGELQTKLKLDNNWIFNNSALRKFVRNVNTRVNIKIANNKQYKIRNKYNAEYIYSKQWKALLGSPKSMLGGSHTLGEVNQVIKTNVVNKSENKTNSLFRSVVKQLLLTPDKKSLKLENTIEKLSRKERKLLKLRTQYLDNNLIDWTFSPLNIYLQKEQSFKHKLRYYGSTSMRKLTVGNTAPYFKTLMKRGFYYYKPSLRWKKTLYVAKIIRGFRKKSRKQRYIVTRALTSPAIGTGSKQKGFPQRDSLNVEHGSGLNQRRNPSAQGLVDQQITRPTHSYAVLGKQASRYRHQIYKDVLQHWYYTPFNRLLLKFDVDAFINRQPKSYFLTKNEEHLLHIRRFLLSEHYDTLRWYTYMQHYKTMKTNIGGTKSFANRTYNQQFQGTFKKIRHLFKITPKQGDFYTLKFDQPLYNDNKLSYNVYYHEELTNTIKDDKHIKAQALLSEDARHLRSSTSISDALHPQAISVSSIKEHQYKPQSGLEHQPTDINKISNFDKNYDLIDQTLLSLSQQKSIGLVDLIGHEKSSGQINTSKSPSMMFQYNDLFVKLIKECKKRVHDMAFLKNYITHRIEKREQLNTEQIKELTKRLEKLKIWYKHLNNSRSISTSSQIKPAKNNGVTAGYPKAQPQQALALNPSGIGLSTTLPKANLELALLRAKTISSLATTATRAKSNTNKVYTKMLKTKQLLLSNSFKQITQQILAVLKARTEKNLSWWRKKQQVITKRKNARKRDRFKKQIAVVNKKQAPQNPTEENAYLNINDVSDYLLQITDSTLLRKKQIDLNKLSRGDSLPQKGKQASITNPFSDNLGSTGSKSMFGKKSSAKGRRYRTLSLARYLTATRKPRLVGFEGLTKVDNISNLKGILLTKEEKQQGLNFMSLPNKVNTIDSLKKSQIKKRSRHTWKKHARHIFSLNHYKYRKRHIHGNGKLRVMNKKLKKSSSINELRQWWWTSFLPRYLNKYNTLLVNAPGFRATQSSNISFKPLSNMNNNIGYFSSEMLVRACEDARHLRSKQGSPMSLQQPKIGYYVSDTDFAKNSFYSSSDTNNQITQINTTKTSLPFYAGWDESLRKFVVTNRLLSRRDTGLVITKQNTQETAFGENYINKPIQGLNEGSFLYLQTSMPFNSYNIDQFISTNQSFYAPLGWRHFEFRHLILKTWALKSAKDLDNKNKDNTLIVSLKKDQRWRASLHASTSISNIKDTKIKTKKAIARRIKKRYKLLKQMPNVLMYSPTGPLLTRVLPSHYISVFDQQYRFPRNRYLKRTTLKTIKKTTLLTMADKIKNSRDSNIEFTLRKRVKPRRKYHRKRFIKKDGLIFPRRTKFTNKNLKDIPWDLEANQARWRPSSKSKQKQKEILGLKTKANKRVKTNPLRLRQLRRREFQQILKPIQRYIPENGGFTWPGDYLRLETVEMPKLKLANLDKTSQLLGQKPGIKRKINVQPVGIMPRKYLILKHNIKVLKKKLFKAYSSHQLSKVVTEYKNII